MLSQSIVNEIDIIFFAHLPQPESSMDRRRFCRRLFSCGLRGSLSAISVGPKLSPPGVLPSGVPPTPAPSW